MPIIRFRIDTALEYASKIDALLADPKVVSDLKKED
jgi:ribosome-binding factor A